MQTVCSPLNKARKATPGLEPRSLASVNPKHAQIYNSNAGPAKLSAGRYAPGALVDGQITIKTPVAIPSDRKG
jgi:hypothetical protein